MNEGASTSSTEIERATKKLHDAMAALGPPPNITYVGIQEVRWGSYDKVLSALRELVRVGGKPFGDDGFRQFFNLLAAPMRIFQYTDKAPENVLERQKFMKTALRICGVEFKPDGSISLMRFSPIRRKRN